MTYVKHGDLNILKIAVNPFYRQMSVYLYFIDGVLIDTGPSIRRRKLIPFLRSWDIQQVAITHHHEDHVGMVRWLANNTSADIYCHTKAIPILQENADIPWYRKLFSGPRFGFQAKCYPEVIRTPGFELLPIETPGHTDEHVCLLEPNKGWLFTGDLYITPYPKVFLKEESITSYIKSLQKLSSYNFHTLFCAHEGVIQDGKEMLERKLDYLQKIRDETITLHRLGCSDREIIKRIFPGKVRLELMSFGSFSRRNLIRSCYRE